MKNQRIRTALNQVILAGILGAVLVGMGAPTAQANPKHGDRWESRHDRWDRSHNRWDRHQDWRQDRHRWGKQSSRWKHYQGRRVYQACECGFCRRGVNPERWGFRHFDAPGKRFGGDAFYFHGDLGVYFGGFALNVELGNRAPRGYLYMHPPTGKTFKSVRTFRSWCRKYPRQERFLTVVPKGGYWDD